MRLSNEAPSVIAQLPGQQLRWAYLSLLATILVVALGACAEDDGWDGNVELWPVPHAGSDYPTWGNDASTAGATDASTPDAGSVRWPDAGARQPDAGARQPDAGTLTPDPSLEIFDPNQIYLLGTLQEGACYRDAIALVTEPNKALVGFDCDRRGASGVIRPSDGRLVYMLDGYMKNGIHIFHGDSGYVTAGSPYPTEPTANDELLPVPLCSDQHAISWFLMSPASEVIYACNYGDTWHDQTGATLPGSEYLSFGAERTVLGPDKILKLDTMELVPITGLPTGSALTVRSRSDGYWMVFAGTADSTGNYLQPELWRVMFDGQASRDGIYPLPPARQSNAFGGKLDAEGRLVEFARDEQDVFVDSIIRRGLDGLSEVIYNEATEPLVKAHISYLVTGP